MELNVNCHGSRNYFRPTEQHGLALSDKIAIFNALCTSECPKEFADRLFPLLFEASAFANLGIDKQFKVSEIMRTELDRIAENNYAREQGVKQRLTR